MKRLRRPRQLSFSDRPTWGEHKAAHPVHLTLRASRGLPSLRSARLFAPVRRALVAARASRGARGLAVRLSRAINGTRSRRGRVWGDRYHITELDSPRQVRHALVYVLMNLKKHAPGSRGLDPRSSAAVFDGWDRAAAPLPLPPARTGLLATGWRRHGRIALDEAPVSPPATTPPRRPRASA